MTIDAELVERRLNGLRELCMLGKSLLGATSPPFEREVLRRRSLVLDGRAAQPPPLVDARDVTFFASPVGVARDVGWMPGVVIDANTGDIVSQGPCALVATSSALSGPRSDRLTRGQRSVVTLRFLKGIPSSVAALPTLTTWDGTGRLWVCSSWDRSRCRW